MSHSNDVVNTNDEINWTEVIKKELEELMIPILVRHKKLFTIIY